MLVTPSSARIETIAGVILAGGRSSRFGRNKAMADLHGKPVIQYVADAVTSVFTSCLLVTNSPQIYDFLKLPATGDIYIDAGPIGGIHAALSHVTQQSVFVVACDMPLVSPPLIRYLCTLDRNNEYDSVVPWPATGSEPLCALYRRSALPVLDGNLRRKNFRATDNLADLKVRRVAEKELFTVVRDLTCFYNINRPEDLNT
jgi:molybdopterin-guanine dinucleotide biosynthesis protein A